MGKGGRGDPNSSLLLPQEDSLDSLDSAGLEFLAPEAVSGDSLSIYTDMWAFGVILYVLLRLVPTYTIFEQRVCLKLNILCNGSIIIYKIFILALSWWV